MWVDTRVIAATNRDIESDIATGEFRRDLYYRLSVITVTVPPLRNRREDIPALTDHYLRLLGARMKKEISGVSDEALEALTGYAWPGNVRELINVLERAVILCRGDEITPADLPQNISMGRAPRMSFESFIESIDPEWHKKSLPELRQDVIKSLERSYLTRVLEETRGRVGEAAERSGIHPRGLYDKMKQYGLSKEEFK